MKHIYLVRHGESEGNVRNEIGGKDLKLSDTGKMQAAQLAERVAGLEIDKLVASDFLRAQETIQPTAEAKKLEVEIVSHFGEMMDATSFFGLNIDDPVVQDSWMKRNAKITDSSYRFEDAENFFDLFARINAAKDYLANLTEENILVVSHAFFLQCFVASMLLDIDTPDESLLKVVSSMTLNNTGITCLTYDEGKWKLIMLNDHARFAE